MRPLIIGASGLIGGYILDVLSRKGCKPQGTAFKQKIPNLITFDITKINEVRFLLNKFKPDVLFISAANSNVDLCEIEPNKTRRVNVRPVEHIIEEALKRGIKIVYFSSDYVFDGTSGPYVEIDIPSPISEYGRQKLQVEQMLQQSTIDFLIVRITVVYGKECLGKNFIVRIMNELKAGNKILIPQDQIGTPTYALDIAETVVRLVENNATGIYHVAGPDLISRYELALLAAEIFGLRKDLLVPVITTTLNQKALRPLRAGLRSIRMDCRHGFFMKNVRDGLKDLANVLN